MQNNGILNVRKRKTKKAQPKLRFFSVAPKEARNGYRCNMSEIWQSSMRYKAFLHLRGFSIWSAYRPQSTIRRKGKGRGDFTYPWRRTFQGGQKALPIFLPTVPLFPALSLKGTQRYIFLDKVLPAPVLFKAPFSDDKAAAVHSLISMLMLCSFIPRDL